MSYWIIFIITLASVNCRPQSHSAELSTSERQKEIEESTRQILEKIAQVNEKQGLNKKRPPQPYHKMYFGYLRNEDAKRQNNEFQFPRDPFTNPVLDYVEKTQNNEENVKVRIATDEDKEDVPPGHFIKRKITHQQSVLVPIPQPYYDPTVENVKNIVGSAQYQHFPYPNPYYRPVAKQFQSPFSQIFPIVIKDPLVQMFNAFTTMIEYGQTGAAPGACKNQEDHHFRHEKLPEQKTTNSTTLLDIEDLQIGGKDPVTMNVRQSKQNQELIKIVVSNSTSQTVIYDKNALAIGARQSPPIRDQYDDDDDQDEDKGVQVSNEGTRRVISKDNTGDGIFVHRIKVRKGGVAIAGPGGIATAGSGGTAIVGPYGYAYTQPDSLAIAGSGSKVIAVEPNVNLTKIILDHSKNKTRGQGHLPSRLGKVVAVGPVIYYNKG